MKRLIALFVLTAAAVLAQPKVVELKHITRSDLGSLLGSFKLSSSSDQSGRVIVLNGDPNEVAVAEALIRKLDVPRKNVELVFHIVAGGREDASAKLPSDLEPVVKQLRNTFAYAGYRLLESFVSRLRDGSDRHEGSGTIPGAGSYFWAVNRVNVSPGEKGNVVRIEGLTFDARNVEQRTSGSEKTMTTESARITSSLDVREGQKVVVGKSSYGGGAYFLVVTAKVVD